ncbi:hypothetical protein KAU30_01960 [Candidatus Bathyarchaeota archaeon]|nr:hypothetical protein [Candidatus Bathyarchaeota archaeon]
MDHVDADSAARVSGTATPPPCGITQTSTAPMAAENVNSPRFIWDICSKAVPIKKNDVGKSIKNATEA